MKPHEAKLLGISLRFQTQKISVVKQCVVSFILLTRPVFLVLYLRYATKMLVPQFNILYKLYAPKHPYSH